MITTMAGKAITTSISLPIKVSAIFPKNPAMRPRVAPDKKQKKVPNATICRSRIRAIEYPREDIAAELVGAHQVGTARRLERGIQVQLYRIVWRDDVREDRYHRNEANDAPSHKQLHAAGVPPEHRMHDTWH